uniref:EF-hand domain-containing protein n=1 Tax=Globisporangium ultimum (strain ATCC 200006 / CBS 805.95 / DAOM BR144) TaxID=431595 RepID=K3WUX9_GLOUD
MAAVTESCIDALQTKLRDIFEIKSGYKDDVFQAKLLEKHFKTFDSDGSGVIDFDEFSRAMVKLNFVGVQAEVEALFDRFDEDLNGVISYTEFAQGVFGHGAKATATSNSLLQRVRDKILDAGGKNGIRTLGVILRRMDQNGNGVIEIERCICDRADVVLQEFQEGLLQLGLRGIDISELERVFWFFDADQSGKITVHELMRGLRGFMAKRRIKIVKEAFARLDTSTDGNATIDEIERLYDPSQHPEVLADRLKPRDALLEFMRVFEDARSHDGTIAWHEFLSYYKDLSAGIVNDDEFELMIRNAWHLSGGNEWCANTTCRRVLVTFRDGSQRVLEIENDLGVNANDKHKMIQKLTEQGYRQIVGISLAN